MQNKVRISAESIGELREFLLGANVDMGCRPVALKRDDQYSTIVISEYDEISHMNIRSTGTINIEILEEIQTPERRLRLVEPGNRFLRGNIPRGLGLKE